MAAFSHVWNRLPQRCNCRPYNLQHGHIAFRQLVALSAFVFALAHVDIAAGFCRRAAEVEIVLIATGDLLQPLDIEQG